MLRLLLVYIAIPLTIPTYRSSQLSLFSMPLPPPPGQPSAKPHTSTPPKANAEIEQFDKDCAVVGHETSTNGV